MLKWSEATAPLRSRLVNWTRREFLALAAGAPALAADTPKIAITMDDVNWRAIPEPFARDANARLLGALKDQRAALFVTGKNVENETGRQILQSWSDAGHLIGNHTYSHRNYSSMDSPAFARDIERCEPIVDKFPGFRKFFRFPMLKEGDTAAKRDWMRGFLRDHGYRIGHVTVDASDWYYDNRLRERLEKEPSFDPSRFRQPYLDHIWDRATYYDGLARRVLGRTVAHTVLIHYNLLNSLFLGDLLDMFRRKGWKVIDAAEAYTDPVFTRGPKTVPAGESLIWALAKESGRFEAELRYPGEDDVYERPLLDRLGL
jgi:peptidoglycan/xylan/chitin deacetylase (PgdA/CDA1 family)